MPTISMNPDGNLTYWVEGTRTRAYNAVTSIPKEQLDKIKEQSALRTRKVATVHMPMPRGSTSVQAA